MKKSLFLFLLVAVSLFTRAQNALHIQSNDKGLYLKHKVAPKENFYSVGRMYNISPKDIAAFTNIDMSKGLVIGQEVSIPLNASNFSQSAANGRPVYYVVGEKEGLYRVSLKHNKVLMASLRKWNNLANDNITTGQKLIVGFLVSPEANAIVAAPETKPEPKTEAAPVKEKEVPVKPEERKPAEEKKPEPVEEKKPEKPLAKPAPPAPQIAVNDGNGGYFKASFEKQSKSQTSHADQTVTAGIFKTASGWQDAKYYALMDGVEPGTIVRIINPGNNKAVYAKVLGEMAGIRQNQGYNLRLSSAAAAALEINDVEKFVVRVNY